MPDLGEKLGEYGLNHDTVTQYLVGAVVMLFFGILGIVGPGVWMLKLVWLGIVGAIILRVLIELSIALGQGAQLAIYQGGIVFSTRASTQSWRWDEFTGYRYREEWLSDAQWIFSAFYRVFARYDYFVDGKPAFTLSRWFEQYEQMSAQVNQGVVAALLPRSRAALQRGEAIQFGNVTLSSNGLHLRRTTLSLYDLKRITHNQASLFIEHYSTPRSTRISLRKRPNPLLLYALLIEIAGQNRPIEVAKKAERPDDQIALT